MKWIRKIYGIITTIYGAIIITLDLGLFLIPVIILNFLKEKTYSPIFYNITRYAYFFYTFFTFSRVKVFGKEYFKKGKNYIVIANHRSFFDIFMTTPLVPRINKTIGKIDIMKVPLFKYYYKLGTVLVDRKSKKSRADSFIKMKKVLENNYCMCVYPEGKRNRTQEPLLPFHDGAFRLSFETKTPIIPSVTFNTEKVMPPDEILMFYPYRSYAYFLPEVDPSNFQSIQELKNHCFEVMYNFYKTHKPNK